MSHPMVTRVWVRQSRPSPMTEPSDLERGPAAKTVGALILARIRATGSAPTAAEPEELQAAATAAANIDRCLLEIIDVDGGTSSLVLGWADGAGPVPDQHLSAPPARLAPVPYLVWAICLAAAWPDPASAPYPGKPFHRDQVSATSVALGAHRPTVITALDRVLPRAGLVVHKGSWTWLGPGAAALPVPVWSALRRVHERLPHAAFAQAADDHLASPTTGNIGVGSNLRRLPSPPDSPSGSFQTSVRAIVTALEIAQGPVIASDLPTLRDPAVRRAVEDVLGDTGRTLISGPDGAWTTGYPDPIAEQLANEGTGTLTARQRAVLTLILLRTVAIPRALGNQLHDGWAGSSHPVTLETLAANRHLSRSTITDALRGLRTCGYVTSTPGGYIPGPALARLSANSRQSLWEDLIVLGRPDGYLADQIRSRRPPGSTGALAPDGNARTGPT